MSRRSNNGGGEKEPSSAEGDDEDDVFDEDMEALRRACLLVGANPDEYNQHPLAIDAGGSSFGGSQPDSDSDADDDLELVRNIRNRFSIADECLPLSLKPMSTLPPVSPDDEEDDFETLRAIQRRFSAYESDNLSNNINKSKQSCDFHRPLEMGSSNEAIVDGQTSLERSPMFAFGKTSLPKAALAFVDAIKKNRSQQKFIRNKMIYLEAKIEENKGLRKRFKILKDFQASCRRKTTCALSQKKDPRVQLISAQKTRSSKDSSKKDKQLSAMYYGPDENSHVANYRMALTKFPLSVDRKKWSSIERENLGKGIRQQFQEMVHVGQINGPEGFLGDSDDIDNILAPIKELDITPYNIREFLPKVNWDRLASMYLVGRSGAECETRWLNFEDPLINQNPWTAIEDKNLLFIIQQKGINNWIDIAVSLGTNRTPFQCLSRYQRSLNASILKREWTKEEDDKLRSAVATFGQGDWQAVASALEGRAGTQCSNRWKKSLDPARTKRGSFTPDEDNRLRISVMLFGPKNWNKKAEILPGRNQVQCRERWYNCLDPSLRRCEWTEEEDLRLELAIQEHGYSWAKVATCVPSRTDNDCRRRWKKLFPNEVPLLQEARRIQKAALISNFVDRESERPALGPTDFQPLPNTNILCDTKNSEPVTKRNVKSRRTPVLRKEKNALGDTPKKTKTSKRRNQADGVTAEVGIGNKRSSVSDEAKAKKPRRKINRDKAYSDTRKGVPESRLNNECCAEQNLETHSFASQMSARESEMTNGDCTANVDENSTGACENTVAEMLSRSDVCFMEQAENQNSTGSSGVSVLSETTNDMDHRNPPILPDRAVSAITVGDAITERNTCKLPSRRNEDLDLADSNSFSSPHGCLDFRIPDGEGVNSCSIGNITSDDLDRICKHQCRRKRSVKISNKSRRAELERTDEEHCDDGTFAEHHNRSKKRKLASAAAPNDANPILPNNENSKFMISSCGFQSMQDTPALLACANNPEGPDLLNRHSDRPPDSIGQNVCVEADDCTLASFLQKKLKRTTVASFLKHKLKKRKHQALVGDVVSSSHLL